MAVKVRIPSPMRAFTQGAETMDIEGATVGDVLHQLVAQASGIQGKLFKPGAATPTLNRFVNIYVNDEDIRFLKNLETPVTDRDTISIVPAIAGGADGDLSPRVAGNHQEL
jgi:sulfur-carrier protein